MEDEVRARVAENLEVAKRLARGMTGGRGTCEREDATCVALLALVEAARAYDPRVGCPFRAFAILRMRWAILMRLRDERRHQRPVLLDGLLFDTFEAPGAGEDRARRRAELERALEALPARQRDVVHAHYFEDEELQAVAKRTGRGYATIRRWHRGALDALRSALSPADSGLQLA